VASEIHAANNGVGLTGAAYGSNLMSLKVLDASGSGSSTTICTGIRYAIDHGAKVINMSLGGGHNTDYQAALQYASDHNVVVVMAAGNSGAADPLDPAAYAKQFSNCIAVGALSCDTTNHLAMTSFSNKAGSGPYGYVDAAGQGVWGYGLDGKVYAWNGTSMAAPLVASEAALIWSANSNLTAAQVVSAITDSAHAVI
jgi:subtilisin family serine protease